MFSPEAAREILSRVDSPLSLLEGLFVHSPVGVQLYSADGHSLFVNQAFLEVFGTTPPPDYCVLRDELAVQVGVDGIIRDAFSGKPGKLPVTWYDPRELKHVRIEEGKRCAIETVLVPICGEGREVRYVVFFFRDVTSELLIEQEKQATEKRLKEANVIIDGLLNGSKAVIYAKDLEGRFLFANRQYGRVTGLSPEVIVGKLQHEVHPPEVAAMMRENDLRVLETKEQMEFEESVVHPDGQLRSYISLKFPLTGSDGTVYGLCGISTDITEVRQLEKELAHARKMEALGLLAGGVAHDFNNLLGVLLLNSESLARQLPAEALEARRDLDNIRVSIDRASALVRHLLAFGRRLPMTPRPTDLNEVVRDLQNIISKLLGGGTDFALELDSCACTVMADPGRLEQVLLNLFLNSRDAVAGTGRIRVRSGRETLRGDEAGLRLPAVPGSYCYLEVSDDGAGMSPDVLERACQPFFTTKKPGEGTGLGLATVFGTAQENLGNLFIESSPGKGCRVRVYLPEHGETKPPPAAREVARRNGPRARQGTAIVIEDEPLLRQITARRLRDQGFRVLEVADGSEVRPLLRANPEVSLIVTDVVMPGKSGPSLVRELRNEGLLDNVGVLFVSGYSHDELERYELPHDSLLEKPFTEQNLIDMVNKVLRPHSQR